MNGGAAQARIVATIALAMALPLLLAPAAQAGCGGVEKAGPKHKVAPRPPLAIGDSSMLLALPALARVGYKVNARGCRQFSEGPKRKLGLVTPRELGGGESNDARVIRNANLRDPEHIKVLDWVHYSAGHSNWFQPDGLHLTFTGAKAFARLLKKLIPLAR